MVGAVRRVSAFLLASVSVLQAETAFDGRFYQGAVVVFEEGREAECFGLTVAGGGLDSRPGEGLRVRGFVELPWWHERRPGVVIPEVRVFNVSVELGSSRLVVGRFLPRWGFGRVFSPLDVFRRVELVPDGLEPTGVDGFLWKAYGGSWAVGVVGLPERRLTGSRALVFGEAGMGGVEAQALGLYDGREGLWTAGLGMKLDTVVGVYGEGVFVAERGRKGGGYGKLAAGLDGSWGGRVFVAGGVFFDGGGAWERGGYVALRVTEPERATLGMWYGEADVHGVVAEGVKVGVAGVGNLGDGSGLVGPYGLVEWGGPVMVGWGWYVFWGGAGTEFGGPRSMLHGYGVVRF